MTGGAELLDAYADDGRHLGALPRAVVHRNGLWHKVFHCLVVADRGGVPTVVLQRRGLDKAGFPGLLDLTATGHLAAGESVADGVRELAEEVGLRVPFAALTPLPVRRMVDADARAEGANRELVHTFLLRDDRPLRDYTPAPAEVAGLLEVAADDVRALFAARRRGVPARGTDRTTQVELSDFVPDLGGYWPDLMSAATALVLSCAADGGSAPPG